MSYLQVTAVRPSIRAKNQYNTVRVSPLQSITPVNILNLQNSLKPLNKCTKLLKCPVIKRTSASQYQQCTPVCLFGGKGDSKNSDEGSPWKPLEKVMSGFKKEPSLEDVLRKQIEKKDYFDGGSDGEGGGGGGFGGGDGFGGPEDEGFGGILDDILQVTLAILALVVLYLFIIAGDQVKVFLTDSFDFLSGKRGPPLKIIMQNIGELYQKLNTRTPYDPYWLEKSILTTTTLYDGPKKYMRILKSINRGDSDSDSDSDSDDDDNRVTSDNNTNSNDDDDSENVNDEDSDNDDILLRKKVYGGNDIDDDDGFDEDDDVVDDEY